MFSTVEATSRVETDSRNDDVGCNQEDTLQVVASAVQDKEVNNKGGDKETNCFKQRKVKRHVLVHTPAQDDDQWCDENRCRNDQCANFLKFFRNGQDCTNLNTTTNRHTD